MSNPLVGAFSFFGILGGVFMLAPRFVAARLLGKDDPGPEGLRGIRTGGVILQFAAAILASIFLYSQFVTE